jgi:hypothetical protein
MQNPKYLNQIDFKEFLKRKEQGVNNQIPKINCQIMVSDFNRKMKDNRERKKRIIEKLMKEKEEKEFIENIKNNLFKKDSLKVLLEKQEASLHLADHINESPSQNTLDMLNSIYDTIHEDISEIPIDKKILQ